MHSRGEIFPNKSLAPAIFFLLMAGFILIPRDLFNSELWTKNTFSKAQAFIDLVQLAVGEKEYTLTIKLNQFQTESIVLNRGQVLYNFDLLAVRWGWTNKIKVSRFIKELEKYGLVEKSKVLRASETSNSQKVLRAFCLLTICNYDSYRIQKNQNETSKNESCYEHMLPILISNKLITTTTTSPLPPEGGGKAAKISFIEMVKAEISKIKTLAPSIQNADILPLAEKFEAEKMILKPEIWQKKDERDKLSNFIFWLNKTAFRSETKGVKQTKTEKRAQPTTAKDDLRKMIDEFTETKTDESELSAESRFIRQRYGERLKLFADNFAPQKVPKMAELSHIALTNTNGFINVTTRQAVNGAYGDGAFELWFAFLLTSHFEIVNAPKTADECITFAKCFLSNGVTATAPALMVFLNMAANGKFGETYKRYTPETYGRFFAKFWQWRNENITRLEREAIEYTNKILAKQNNE